MQGDAHSGLRRRLIRGFGAQGLQLVMRTVQQVFLVPLLISVWGAPLYADWIVLYAAASFVPMLELGTQAYFGNLLLAAWAAGDRARFDRTLHTALGVQIGIVALACAAAALGGLLIEWPAALGTRALTPHAAVATLLLLSAGNLATVPQGVICTIYRARGEFSRLVNTVTLLIALETGGMAVAVMLGGSPVTTAAIYSAAIALCWVLIVVDQRRRYPDLRYGVALPGRAEFKEIASTAPFYLVTSATATVVVNGPVLVLHAVAPGASIVLFSTSRLLVGILRQLTHQLAHASGVEMARQRVQGEAPALRALFVQTGKLVGGVWGLLGGVLMAGGAPFFQVWTRGNVVFEPWLFAALLVTVYLIAPGQAALTYLYYSNQPRPISIASAGHALIGLALCALLAPMAGANGVAIGMGLAEFGLVGLWLAAVGARSVGVPLAPYLLATYGTGALCFGASLGIAETVARLLRPQGLLDLLIFGAVWSAAAAVPAFFVLLDSWQRTWLLSLLGRRRARSA